jgi:hypothetical protein
MSFSYLNFSNWINNRNKSTAVAASNESYGNSYTATKRPNHFKQEKLIKFEMQKQIEPDIDNHITMKSTTKEPVPVPITTSNFIYFRNNNTSGDCNRFNECRFNLNLYKSDPFDRTVSLLSGLSILLLFSKTFKYII